MLRRLLKTLLPRPVREILKTGRKRLLHLHPVGTVNFGNLRRTAPIGRDFGYDRGTCIDRYYIEQFLDRHAADIRGRVLEVADRNYTRRYGGDCVTQSDVLHRTPGNTDATLVADLADAPQIPDGTFDCILLTQTLQFIFDVAAAVRTLHRILKPEGTLLVTVPGISPISRYDDDRWGDYWRFTRRSAERLFSGPFPAGSVEIGARGNVLSSTAFLHGLAAEELHRTELDKDDPVFPMLITIRAVRRGGSS